MNKGNFTAKDNFPVSTFTYDFLQKMAHLAGNLAQLGGQNYILSGCVVTGTTVSAGLIVINGEILPFEAGTKKTKITIQETMDTDHFNGIDYPESYIHRVAKFADNGEYNWSDFVQVLTNKQLETKISSIRGEPPGFKMEWTGREDRIPDNYLLADGRILLTADYPELAWYYGAENEESFRLPDLRKRFIVGYDGASNSDYNKIGNTGGEEKVTLTIAQTPEHRHPYTDDTNAQGKYPQIEEGFPTSITGIANVKSSAESSGWGTVYNSGKVGGGQAHENRPPFYVLAFLIKVKY